MHELAFSAAQPACAASGESTMPRTLERMASPQKVEWERRHVSRRWLHTWTMGLGAVLSSLLVILLLDLAGCSTSSARQMAPLSGTRPVWLPKGSPSDLVGILLSPLHPPFGSVVHALFALVAADNLECDSNDITTAFLNGDPVEEIYMKPPEGYYEQYSQDGQLLYCLLLKALYG